MSNPEVAQETTRERECFEQALTTALDSDEVKIALGRFPQLNPPDLRGVIEGKRGDIWARVPRAHRRVRELEERRSALWRRIVETDPGVRAASADAENEFIRLSNSWAALSPEADQLGLRPRRYDPTATLAEIGRRLADVIGGARTFAPLEPYEPTPTRAESAVGRAWARRLQKRLIRRRLNPRRRRALDPLPRLAEIVLAALDGGADQTRRVEVGLTWLQRDISTLKASLDDHEAAVSAALALASQGNREYATLANELEVAWQRLAEQLLNYGILDTLRLALNDFLQDLYTVCMPGTDAPALSEPLAADKPVSTPAIETMRTLLDRMHGASIGVAGPRGAGKSTLIDAFCTAQPVVTTQSEEQKPWLGLRVSAPVEYEPRDFILYLFAELCRRVVPGAEPEIQPAPVAPPSDPRRFLRLCLGAVTVAGALAAGWGALLVAGALRSHPSLARPVSGILAGILVAIAFAILRLRAAARIVPQPARPEYLSDRFGYGKIGGSAWLITLFVGATFAALAIWTPPMHPSIYAFGAAAIAVSGPIWFTGVTLPPPAGIDPAYDDAAYIAEYDRSGQDLLRLFSEQIQVLTATCVIVGAAAIGLSFAVTNWSLSLLAGLSAIFLGGLALCGPLVTVRNRPYSADWLDRAEIWGYRERGDRLEKLAIESLIAIRFQQTISSDWSAGLSLGGVGGVSLPIAVQSQWSQGASWARQPQSYPELVGRFREFAESVAQRYRVVIGIDELDKLESGVKAEQFLNDIKGIFGVRGCYFLVSVSEDAAASFDRRGLPFRDVFDTCFDTVVTVGYLDLASARQLLYSRVIGWPIPFVALCYVLSGGLARDLLRVARLVIRGLGAQIGLAETARRLCAEEARARTHGLQHQLIRTVGDGPGEELLGLLADMPNDSTACADHATYLDRSRRLQSWAANSLAAARAAREDDRRIAAEPMPCRWARDLSALYLFLATVLEFFSDRLPPDDLALAEDTARGAGSLDRLAAARQQMSVNTRVAVRYIEEFRGDWHLD